MVLKPVAFKDDKPAKFKMVKVCRLKPTTPPPPATTPSTPTTTYCYRYIGTLCIPSWDGYIMWRDKIGKRKKNPKFFKQNSKFYYISTFLPLKQKSLWLSPKLRCLCYFVLHFDWINRIVYHWLKWIYSMGKITISFNIEFIRRLPCYYGQNISSKNWILTIS